MNSIARNITAGTTVLSPTDAFLNIDTSQGAVTIVTAKISTILADIQKSGNFYSFLGVKFIDISNNASVNNITFICSDGDLVNNSTSIVIDTDGGGGMINFISENQWIYTPNAVTPTPVNDKNYVLQITTPSILWSVPHNLNKKVSVQTTNNSLEQTYGIVRWVNNNEVEITWSTPRVGWVFCN